MANHFGERGGWNKNRRFELTPRTPWIMVAPEMRAKGTTCSRLVEFIDIFTGADVFRRLKRWANSNRGKPKRVLPTVGIEAESPAPSALANVD